MGRRITGWASALWLVAAGGAAAQDGVWVQVEAQPTLTGAQDRARAYAARLPDVAGFALGSGWYAVAIGPFSRDRAQSVRAQLLASGAIPPDAFLAEESAFRGQFWPAGGRGLGRPRDAAPAAERDPAPPPEPTEPPGSTEPTEAPETPELQEPQETLAEARAAEAALTLEDRRGLQVALQWAGVYAATIDGLFGPGTRASMATWQQAQGHVPTGVLTTRQRAELLEAYDSVLDGMDLARIVERRAGIAIELPRGAVTFAEIAPPFLRYEATGAVPGATVLLISQPGDGDTLSGLYEILQTLEIVPPEGERERSARGFSITGEGAEIVTRAEAVLADGWIKGWMLVWPAGDEDRRSRIAQAMATSFEPLAGGLDPASAPAGEDQSIDLVSGLEIRLPLRTRSGVFVTEAGEVLTVAEAVAGCGSVTIDGDNAMNVTLRDDEAGIALLAPRAAMAPVDVATFQTGVPRIGGRIAVAGFPFGGAIAAPALTFGTLADIRGLNGETDVKRIEAPVGEGDAGGPVLDGSGAVLGLLLPAGASDGRQLPAGVHYVIETDAILAVLGDAGLPVATAQGGAPVSPERLTRLAGDIAAAVECWE